MLHRTLFLISVVVSLPCFAQSASLESALAKPILPVNQPLVEVQVYTASHVKSMPMVSSAQQWTQVKERLRQQVLNEVVLRGEGRKWAEAKTRVEWLDVLPGKGYRIKRLRYEVIPGLWIPALLYEPEKLGLEVRRFDSGRRTMPGESPSTRNGLTPSGVCAITTSSFAR